MRGEVTAVLVAPVYNIEDAWPDVNEKVLLFAEMQMTYADLEYEKMTRFGSPEYKPLYPSAHIGEHSLNVHPSGFALLLMICAISTPVSISINGRFNRVASEELAGGNSADGRWLARAFWHGRSVSMSSARGQLKQYYKLEKSRMRKRKKKKMKDRCAATIFCRIDIHRSLCHFH